MKTSTLSQKLYAFGAGLLITSSVIAQTPDLGKLSPDGKTIKYVAIGSSLSAGVRDGGVYAEAQRTSFPALLAQQMGITDFKQPLLEGNGTGRKTVSANRFGGLEFTEIKGLDDKSLNAQLPKVVGEVANLALPYQKVIDIQEYNQSALSHHYNNRSFSHLTRFRSEGESGLSYPTLIAKNISNYSFFIFEFGWFDFQNYIESGGYGTDISYMIGRENNAEKEIIEFISNKVSQGIILNVPDILKFPLYKGLTYKTLKQKYGLDNIYIEQWSKTDVRKAKDDDIFLINDSFTTLLNPFVAEASKKGLTENDPIMDEQVLDVGEQRLFSPSAYNELLAGYAKKYNVPVVDLYSLYEKILAGNYTTHDGVKVQPDYPNGNFFSTDGTTPTALGQAIIANECIRILNQEYASTIPLVNTIQFSAKK